MPEKGTSNFSQKMASRIFFLPVGKWQFVEGKSLEPSFTVLFLTRHIPSHSWSHWFYFQNASILTISYHLPCGCSGLRHCHLLPALCSPLRAVPAPILDFTIVTSSNSSQSEPSKGQLTSQHIYNPYYASGTVQSALFVLSNLTIKILSRRNYYHPFLQKRQLRSRKVKYCAKGHTAGKWQNLDSNPGRLGINSSIVSRGLSSYWA